MVRFAVIYQEFDRMCQNSAKSKKTLTMVTKAPRKPDYTGEEIKKKFIADWDAKHLFGPTVVKVHEVTRLGVKNLPQGTAR